MCSRTTTNKIVAVSESGRKFRLSNPKQQVVEVTHVDGCAIKVGIRCDYLYRFHGDEVFVELKGADVRHAADQISASVSQLARVPVYQRTAVIVTSRVPNEDSSTQRAKFKLRRLASKVLIKNSSVEIVVSQS